MNNEQENKWREEFLKSDLANSTHEKSCTYDEMCEIGYIAGRKKAQEEIDSTSFRRGYELVKSHEKEIAQLKEELKREREAVDELLRVHGMHDKDLANYEWETCCNGHMCGCYGMPTDPGYYEYNSRESARQTQQQRK